MAKNAPKGSKRGKGNHSPYCRHQKRPHNYSAMYRRLMDGHADFLRNGVRVTERVFTPLALHMMGRGRSQA